MPSIVLQINLDNHEELVELGATRPKEWAREISNLFKSAAAGIRPMSVVQFSDDTALAFASGTVTVASIQADDTITISGVTLTGKASPAGESQFDSDGSDTVVATAIAACINAHSSLVGIVTASSSAAVVTISAAQKGLMGNAITLASSDNTRLAVSAARLANGTGAGESAVTYSLGK